MRQKERENTQLSSLALRASVLKLSARFARAGDASINSGFFGTSRMRILNLEELGVFVLNLNSTGAKFVFAADRRVPP